MTCRLSQIVDKPKELLEALLFPVDLSGVEVWQPKFNIAPRNPALAVHGVPNFALATMMLWAAGVGRLRPWARDDTFVKGRYGTLKRCVIAVPGFYDWPSKTKTAFFVQPVDRKILTFAGLYVEHEGGGTFSVMTTDPNADIKPLHHRMAIYLEPKECELWLNPATPKAALDALMKQWPVGRLKNYRVSTRCHDGKNDDPSCVEPFREDGGNNNAPKKGGPKKGGPKNDDGRGIPKKNPPRNLFQ